MKSVPKRMISLMLVIIMAMTVLPFDVLASTISQKEVDNYSNSINYDHLNYLDLDKLLEESLNLNDTQSNSGDISVWIPASELQNGQTVLERRWDYDLTTTIESSNSSVPGYVCTGNEWRESGTGSQNWAVFPDGFDTTHQIYTSFAKAQPYSESETTTTKRVVANVKAGYVYWHWMYSSSTYSNNMKRPIYNKKGTGPATGYVYKTMQAQLSSIDHPRASSGYVENTGLPSYDVSTEFNTFATIGHTSRCFRFEYYSCSYTDYTKVYFHSKTESLSSSEPVTEGNGISNIVEMVRIQLSECDENGISPWIYAENAPAGADIVDRKWTYKLREYCESTNPSLAGWTLTGSYWRQTGTGSLFYGTPDGTYQWDPNDENYSILTNQPYTPSETNTTKREVTNGEYGYCYWKWDFLQPTNGTTWRYSSWNNVSEKDGEKNYIYFASIIDTEEWTRWRKANGSLFISNSGNLSYTYKGYPSDVDAAYNATQQGNPPTYPKPDMIGNKTDSFSFFGFKINQSSYVDYEKVFQYTRQTTHESSTEVVAGNGISDVVAYVKYVVKVNIELGSDGYYHDSICGLKYTLNASNNTVEVCGIDGSTTNVKVPTLVYYNDASYKVASISNNAFKNKSGINSIALPNGLISIGNNAFEGCTGLEAIVIPSTVTAVGNAAFKNCTGLTSAVIGDKLNSISASMFDGCTNLEKVSLGLSVAEVKTRAFAECRKLLWVFFSGVRPDDGKVVSDAFYRSSSHSGDSVISIYYIDSDPKSRWTITDGWGAGNWLNETNSGFENNVEWRVYGAADIVYLNENGFDYQGVKYSFASGGATASVVSLSNDDNSLKNIVIPDKVFYLNNEYRVTSINASAFSGNTSIESVVIGSNVTSIQNSAFSNCPKLNNVTVRGTLNSVGNNVFLGSSSIKALYFLGNAPASVGSNIFNSSVSTFVICSESATGFGNAWQTLPVYHYRTTTPYELEGSKYVKDDISGINYFIIDSANKEAIVGYKKSTTTGEPDNGLVNAVNTGYSGTGEITIADFIMVQDTVYKVVGLDRFAFYKSNVSKVNLGRFIGSSESEPGIWDCSFLEAKNLTAVSVNSNNDKYASNDGVLYTKKVLSGTTMYDRLMLYPAAKTGSDYTIPSSYNTVTINQYALSGQKYLNSFTCSNVTLIGANAFDSCSSLSSVTMGKVETIEDYAFRNCHNLSSVSLPVIKKIGNGAFEDCASLGTVSLTGIQTIGEQAFARCPSLTGFTVSGSSNYYSDSKGALLAHESDGDVLIQYPTSANYTSYSVSNNVKKISSYAFYAATKLHDITVGNNVTEIGSNAFENCTGISEFSIGARVKTIGSFAFEGCTSLGKFKVLSDGNLVNTYFFADDSGVLYAYNKVAGSEVTSGELKLRKLLYYPMALQRNSYTVYNGVEVIGENAFLGNSSIVRVILPSSINEIENHAFKDCLKLKEVFFKGGVPDVSDSAYNVSNIFENIVSLKLYYTHENASEWTSTIPIEFSKYLREEYNAIEELPNVITPSNVYGIRVINSKGGLLRNATVSFNGSNMTPVYNGELYIYALGEMPDEEIGIQVIVTCEGYADYNNILYIDPELMMSYITLPEIAKVSGVSFNGTDISTKSVSINKWTFSETAGSLYIGRDDVDFVINASCDTDIGDVITKLAILQDGNVLAIREATTSSGLAGTVADRTFTIPAASLEQNGKLQVYMEVMRTDRTTYSVTEKLNVSVFYEPLPIHGSEEATEEPSSTAVPTNNPVATPKPTRKPDKINPNEVITNLTSQSICIKATTGNSFYDSIKFELGWGIFDTSIEQKDTKKDEYTIKIKSKDIGKLEIKIAGELKVKYAASKWKLISSSISAEIPIAKVPLPAIKVPIGPISAKVEVKVELSAAGKLTFVFDAANKLKFDSATLTAKGKIEASAAIGVDILWGLASAYVGIKGKLSTDVTFNMVPFSLKEWKVAGGIYLFLELTEVWFLTQTFEVGLAETTNEVFLYKNGTWLPQEDIHECNRIVHDVVMAQLMKANTAATHSISKSNSAMPLDTNGQLVSLSDNKIIKFWIADANNYTSNAEYDDYNYEKILYSVGTKNGSNWIWSTARLLDDNGFIDSNYSVCANGGNAYVVYSQLQHKIVSGETSNDVTQYFEIKVAKFNGTGFDVEEETLSSDAFYDSQPKMAVVNGNPTVIWQKNIENSITGISIYNYFDEENSQYYAFNTEANEIWGSVYDPAADEWSTSCVVDRLPLVTSFDIGGNGDVLLTIDPDSNPFTTIDGQIVNDHISCTAVVGSSVHYADLEADYDEGLLGIYSDNGQLYYINGSKIYRLSDNSMVADTGIVGFSSYKVISDNNGIITAVLFVASADEYENEPGDVLYGMFSRNGEFGEPVVLTSLNESVFYKSFDAEQFGDELLLLVNTISKQGSDTVYGKAMSTYDLSAVDLSVNDVSLDNILKNGQSFSLNVVIENKSAANVDSVIIEIKNPSGTVVSQKTEPVSIPSGNKSQLSIEMPGINTITSGNYTVVVKAASGEIDYSNNSFVLPFAETDLVVTSTQLVVDEENRLIVRVANEGNIIATNINLYVFKDVQESLDEAISTGREMYTLNCGNIGPNTAKYYEIRLDEDFFEDGATGIVEVYAKTEAVENYIDNNQAYVSVVSIPDNAEALKDTNLRPYLLNDTVQYELVGDNADLDIAFVPNGYTLEKISEGEELSNSNYTIYSNKLTLKSSYVKSLGEGTHIIELTFRNNSNDTFARQLYLINYKGYFNVTFIVDGSVSSNTYTLGSIPSYQGNLEKPNSGLIEYTFAGWDINNDGVVDIGADRELNPVYEDATYEAVYDSDSVKYSVMFDVDGRITIKEYPVNSTPVYNGTTVKAEDDTYTYAFAGWDVNNDGLVDYQNNTLPVVTGNVTYVAVFATIYKEYEIKFVNWDDELISSAVYHYGDTVTLPATPTKPSDTEYRYVFAGWTPDVVDVVADATYKATFTAVEHSYAEPVYEWIQDTQGYTVKATAVCEDDNTYNITETVSATYNVITPAGCETLGVGRYTAVFTNEMFETQTKEVSIPASGHNYGEPEWIWSDDKLSAQAVFTCLTCSHIVTVDATVNIVRIEPTLEEDGSITYTATAQFEGAEYNDVVTVVLPATGHVPGDINGDGVFDYYDVTKLYSCYRGKATISNEALLDVNKDGVFDYYDVTKLYSCYRGKSELP